MDPVLNIDEFARPKSLEWDRERSLDGDVVSRRRVFDHTDVGFAKLTEICEECKDDETIIRCEILRVTPISEFSSKSINHLSILR